MRYALVLTSLSVALAMSHLHAQDRRGAEIPPGPMGPYTSPYVDSLSIPVIRELKGGTLTMVHAPAELNTGTAWIALFVDDAAGRPEVEAEVSCWLHMSGEPDSGVRVYVQPVKPGRFLIRHLRFKQAGTRELAMRVIRPHREDEIVYFKLTVGQRPVADPTWPGVKLPHARPPWSDSRAEARSIPGGRLTMRHSPAQPRVGRIDFQFLVQADHSRRLPLSAGLYRAGIGDFFEELHLTEYTGGVYIGSANVTRSGLYVLRAIVTSPGQTGCTVQFEMSVIE